ncbi:hypothetical protein [Candidatus Nitrososphaera gargensis]|uniref:hypothetical protein n=1 Tax=Candidatus Nitrososphaera gargensis TaxID=497727 RepID=UPI0011E54E1B|nr:hypothetical protein [Candidatus Nitrososphaera gargensis]
MSQQHGILHKERRYYSILDDCPACGANRLKDNSQGLNDKGKGDNRIVYCRTCGWVQTRRAVAVT